MTDTTLVMYMGLPRSGKTTEAHKTLYHPIVNPDSIRLALHGQAYYPPAEPFVWAIAKAMVASLFRAGHLTVILDATNITRKRRDEWKNIAAERDLVIMRTDLKTCLQRAEESQNAFLPEVIRRMHDQWEEPEPDEGFMLVSEIHP